MKMIHALSHVLAQFDETEPEGRENLRIYKNERFQILKRNKKNNMFFHNYIDWINVNQFTPEGKQVADCISSALHFKKEQALLAYEIKMDKLSRGKKKASTPKYDIRLQYEQQPLKKNGTVYTMPVNDGNIDEQFCTDHKQKIIEVFASPIGNPTNNIKNVKSRQELIIALFKKDTAAFKFQEGSKPTIDDIVNQFYKLTVGGIKKDSPQLCVKNNTLKEWLMAMASTNCGVQMFEGSRTPKLRLRSISSNVTYQSNVCKLVKTSQNVLKKTQQPEWNDIKIKRKAQELVDLLNQPFSTAVEYIHKQGPNNIDNQLCLPVQICNSTKLNKLTYSNKGQTRCALHALIHWAINEDVIDPVACLDSRPILDQSATNPRPILDRSGM